MAQTIKLKRSATSGAVPTTSALDLGEMAINTHDGKVYIKKDDGTESVVEVGDTSGYLPLSGGTLTGALKLEGGSYSSGIDTATVSLAVDKGDYIYSDDGSYLRRILGHTAGGVVEIGQNGTSLINSVNLLTGTAGNSAAKVNGNTIWNAGNDGPSSGLDADLLDGQHGSYYYPASNPNGYTNDQTAAEILTAIKTVDGSGSGLDADTVDGHHAYESQILDTRDSGDVTPNGFGDKRVSYSFTDDIAGSTHTWDSVITVKGWSDTYRAWQITSNSSNDDTDQNLYFRSGRNDTWGSLRTVWDSGNDGPGSGLNADLLDGWEGSSYVNTSGTQSIGGGKSFGNILTVDGGQTGGYPLQRMTSSSVSTYGRIEFGYTGQVSRGRLQYNNTGDSMAFYTATAERARVTSAGDILVNKTASNTSVVGNEIKASGNIYATQDYAALSSQLLLRNNSSTDSLVGLGCYNGLSSISTTSSTGGGHSLSISGGMSGEYARFTNDKRLGIGTTAPVERLHVIGNIVATGNITAYYSDERLKDLKGTIPNALDKVNQLNGYYYTPNETAQALGVDNKGLEVGISAQEVEAVLPEIVTKSAIGDDYKTVWYEKLTPLLIEAVKELTEKVDKLEARLTELEK